MNDQHLDQLLTQKQERLSALMDGELDASAREATIDTLLKDPQARQSWQRHHLISDTLHRNLPSAIDNEFAARVKAAIKDEPTILAPMKRDTSLFTRRVAGLAVAASVAVVGVLSVQFMVQNDDFLPLQHQMAAQEPTTQAPISTAMQGSIPHSLPRSGIQLVEQKGGTAPSRRQPDLGKYLLDHNQQAARSVQGVIPYARIVTYPNTARNQAQAQAQAQAQGQR